MTRSAPTITCEEAEDLLPLVADGVFTAQDEPALFLHLADCPRCRESLRRHDLITLALIGAKPPASPKRIIPFPRRSVLGALAAAAVVTLSLFSWQSLHDEPSSAPAMAQAPAARPVATERTTSEEPAIEVEVVTIPGNDPGRPNFLIRRHDQVTLVTPAPDDLASPADVAVPATYNPNRY